MSHGLLEWAPTGAASPRDVSVVIPTRRRPELVLRAVASALGQTLPPAEVIVVVDGPDDVTERALHGVDDDRLTVLTLPCRRGGAGARNAGIAAARGTWIALLDDDDEWLPDKLAQQSALLEDCADPLRTVVGSRVEWVSESASMTWPLRAPRPDERVADYLFVRTMPGEGFLATPSVLLSRELAVRCPLPEHLVIHEDFDWFLQLEHVGATFAVAMAPLVRVHAARARVSVSRQATWRQSLDWALSRRAALGPRAFGAFCLTEVARTARDARSVSGLLRAFLYAVTSRPRPVDLARFVVIALLPEATRWRLRAVRKAAGTCA